MALDTRLIGQALGGGRPLNIAGAVAPAIAKGERAIAISQARAEAKKAAHDKAIKEREEFSAKLIGQFKMPSFKGVPGQGMGWLTEQASIVKNNVYSIATNKNLTPTQQQILINEEKQKLNDLEYWANEYKESMADFIDKTDMISQVNTEQDLLLDKMRVAGEYTIEGDKALFSINNNIIEKPVSELPKGFNLIEQDHIAYNDLLTKVANVAKKTATQGKNKNALEYEITEGINSLKLTDMQYLTIAVDQLGYTGDFDIDTIRKEAKDKNPDKIDNQKLREQIINFVNNNVRQSADKAFAAYFEPTKPTSTDNKNIKLDAEEYAEELNNALSNYDFSMFNNTKIGGKLITGSEIRNGKLYLEYTARTTAEGQEMAELAGIDLNDKVRLKALLSEYIKGQKGLNISNKISNNITDEMLFTIEDINKQNSILFSSPTVKPSLP